MKPVYLFISLCLIFAACKKDLNETNNLNAESADQLTAHLPNDAVLAPTIDSQKTAPSQYIPTGDFGRYINYTLNFAAKKSGIKIISLTFVAYETSDKDARLIRMSDSTFKEGHFASTTKYPKAKAAATISGLNIKIHSGGVLTPIGFSFDYNATDSANSPASGDTVSIRLAAVQYTDIQRPDTVTESVYSSSFPVVKLTYGIPGVYSSAPDTNRIQTGLTQLISLDLASTNYITMNNLPIQLNLTNVSISPQLVLKDFYGNLINTTTTVSGNNYTMQIPPGLAADDPDGRVFTLYANVSTVKANAVIKTGFQPAAKFSWTDTRSYNKKVFTTDNTKFLKDYPVNIVTVHN